MENLSIIKSVLFILAICCFILSFAISLVENKDYLEYSLYKKRIIITLLVAGFAFSIVYVLVITNIL